jgi:hypothetical protein
MYSELGFPLVIRFACNGAAQITIDSRIVQPPQWLSADAIL